MTKTHRFFLAMVCLSIISSCTKELDISLENITRSRKVSITISRFPPEPIGSTHPWKREVLVYGSRKDFFEKSNPIFTGLTPGMRSKSHVTVDNLDAGFLYLRVNLYEVTWFRGSYYYKDSIMVPAHNCDIVVSTIDGKWFSE